VPGEAILERVRKKSDASGTKYFRTVKLGRGIERIEIEEKITRALYAKLWPLTEGRRVEKRRYAIEDGELTWEIDVFTDRELVLCEVELERADVEVRLPDWLAPYVERDVTDEDTYVNANLAR
jgi:CYTH domain-containing protein